MKTILLVKTSSLGDVVHNLPVASDIAAACPGSRVDWVVEEAFAALPALHPAVQRVLPVAIRRWRRNFFDATTRAEIRTFVRELRSVAYDAVIDTQGLLKSALVTRAARGRRYGLDWRSSREPLALFYDRTFAVPWTLHAVERNRLLAARALSYETHAPAQYGIRTGAARPPWLGHAVYAVLLHATSREHKRWDEREWLELGGALAAAGTVSVLPWHGEAERARSERLARGIPGAVVPPPMDLAALAGLLAGACCVAGVDTGLTHLAAAFDVPTAGVYVATDPAATGVYGGARARNIGGIGKPPAAAEVLAALRSAMNG